MSYTLGCDASPPTMPLGREGLQEVPTKNVMILKVTIASWEGEHPKLHGPKHYMDFGQSRTSSRI